MASSSKKKTTMAKINRENKVREKRLKKQDRKEARKLAASDEGASPTVLADGTVALIDADADAEARADGALAVTDANR